MLNNKIKCPPSEQMKLNKGVHLPCNQNASPDICLMSGKLKWYILTIYRNHYQDYSNEMKFTNLISFKRHTHILRSRVEKYPLVKYKKYQITKYAEQEKNLVQNENRYHIQLRNEGKCILKEYFI